VAQAAGGYNGSIHGGKGRRKGKRRMKKEERKEKNVTVKVKKEENHH